MGKKRVLFLGAEYDISDQLPILVPILQEFDEYKESLMSKLVSQIERNTYVGGEDKDFSYWSQPVSTISKSIIRNAAKLGIYDLTEYELVENNPGYIELNKLCTETLRQILLSQTETMLEWMEGADDAYASAASNITGSGVGILTNSLSSALLYSAMEGHVLRKQAKQADKEYNAAIASLNIIKESKQKQNEARIKKNVYYPGCKESIIKLINYMLDLYLTRLDSNGILDCSEVASYDLKLSSEIMKNLDIVPQKSEVLGKAFEKCPYNSDVYIKALELNLFDDASVETVKYIKLDKDFFDLLLSKINRISNIQEAKTELESKKSTVHLCALFKGTSDESFKGVLTHSIYSKIVADYACLDNALNYEGKCNSFISDVKREEDVSTFVYNYVRGIAPDSDFAYLTKECGYTDLLKKITPSVYEGIKTKEAIDNYYIEQLTKKCKPLVKNRIETERREKEEKEREENKARIKRELLQKERRKRIVKKCVTIVSVCFVIIIVLLTIFVFIPNSKYKKAKQLMDSNNYLQAVERFEQIGANKYSAEINDCKKLYVDGLVSSGKYDEAIDYLKSSMGKDDNSDEVKSCKYKKAEYYYDTKNYEEAITIFQELKGYNKSETRIKDCKYFRANELFDDGELTSAIDLYSEIQDYKDSEERIKEASNEIQYIEANNKINEGNYADAVDILYALGILKPYKDSKELFDKYKEQGSEELFNKKSYLTCINYCKRYYLYNKYYSESNYEYGMYLCEKGNFEAAADYFKECRDEHPDVESIIADADKAANYNRAISKAKSGLLNEAIEILSGLSGYKDASSWLAKCREASRYTGTFNSYRYTVYMMNGRVEEIPAGQNYGDAKTLSISATISDDFTITYSANGRKAEPGQLIVKYHKYSDDDSYIDIANKKIVNEFKGGDKYVTLYK
ncbi:MAG: tetratricopeptide repeat protein [Eubacterium sp.]|nr:tetratricopeptide repeat protein [Eubacterium sp.]